LRDELEVSERKAVRALATMIRYVSPGWLTVEQAGDTAETLFDILSNWSHET
jgi:hypothetical protein